MSQEIVPIETIENKIFLIRSQKVMIDSDLAGLYGVSTKVLNQATKRNIDRFPSDFMFQLSGDELKNLKCHFGTSSSRCQFGILKPDNGARSQFVTLKRGQNIKYLPYAFTEHGILMLSSVLRSPRAIQVNIQIMRAFVRFRRMMADNKEIARKLDLLGKRVFRHDSDIRGLVRDIRKLTISRSSDHRKIGFLK